MAIESVEVCIVSVRGPRDEDPRIGPSRCTVGLDDHLRRDVRERTGRRLPVADGDQPLVEERSGVVDVIDDRCDELRVGHPPEPFVALWAIGRDSDGVAANRPQHVVMQQVRRLVEANALWHFPRHGCLHVESNDDVAFRSDSVRPLDTNTFELKVAETATDLGDYVLRGGTHRATVTFTVGAPRVASLSAATPDPVRRMVDRHSLTALSYRPDTSTISNNGGSMHCTTSLNDVSAIAERLDELPFGVHPMELVRDSLERWLHGAPSYGSGRTSHGRHLLEDEYVHLGADTLLGLARYLRWDEGSAFFEDNAPRNRSGDRAHDGPRHRWRWPRGIDDPPWAFGRAPVGHGVE